MEQAVLFALFNNAALLLVLSVIFELTYLLPVRYRSVQPVFSGLLISVICIAIMKAPFTLSSGILFDTRTILISVTALIFGLIPTAITTIAAVMVRLAAGGAGTLMGIATAVASALIGLGWRRFGRVKPGRWRWLNLLMMGITVHIAMLACTLLLPSGDSGAVLGAIAVPVMLVYPPVSVLLSLLLLRQMAYKQVQVQLVKSEERFRALFDKAPLGYQSLDVEGCFIDVNQQWLDTLGYARDEVIGKWFGDFVPPLQQDALRARFQRFKADGQIQCEIEMLHKCGKTLFVSVEGKIGYDEEGNIKQTHCILQDVTLRVAAEQALRENEKKYSSYIENAPYGIFVVDTTGRYVEVNQFASALTGYSMAQLVGMSIMDITAETSRETAAHQFEKLKQVGSMNAELQYIHADGSIRWWTVNAVKLSEDRYLGFSIDITQKKDSEANLLYLIDHDFLTGMHNRRFFETEVRRLDHPSQLPLSIMIGDINGVKLVNDAFGHDEGDRLIKDCASILSNCCREGDVAARIGGDEFGFLMPRTDSATAMDMLTRIQSALRAFDANAPTDKFIHSVSLGFATKADVDDDLNQTNRIAEEHMYQRKLLEHNSSHSAIISSIKATMSEKSHETAEHAERLVDLSRTIANKLNMPQIGRDRLELLATLHDIGKVGISESVLTKQGKLSEDEWVEMKRHPEIGYRIAVSSPDLMPIAEGILCHHEWWNGSGYPQGLSGENIPLLSRILAVADAYDAMTQDRPYRKAMTHEQAIAEIRRCSGTQFDPEIAQIMIESVQ
ncbi:MAG: PAS domain S-box protein [Christensenellales bacterium]